MELKQRIKTDAEERLNLLIVPYGIETRKMNYSFFFFHAFNRTLWN